MSNKKSLPTVTEIQEKVKRYRYWENYKITHKGSETDLITLYWHCVVSDIIKQYKRVQKRNEIEKEVRNESGERLYYTFLGCFFKTHELYHSLLDKFQGLTTPMYNQGRKQWKQWKDGLLEKTWKEFEELVSISIRNYEVREGIYSDMSIQSYDITAFDDSSPKIPQQVSSALIEHLKNGTLNANEQGTMNAKFFFHLKDRVIEQLHKYGLQYVKARMICELMNDIDGRFEKGEQIITSKIALLEHQSIKDAILDLFNKWPEFKNYSDIEIASVIKQKYKDSSGNELNRGSIKKALSRMDEKERNGYG